ncbi:hypothetical protein V8J88_10985 [Massilia sp. W12]|uniref:AtuA-related protein n=1 Tax=Massilia sp. W12 TaxID=3126507 RepID=UPI0030D4D61B
METQKSIYLAQIAHARGGDKGNSADLSLFLPDAASYALAVAQIDEAAVAQQFSAFFANPQTPKVERYCLPGLLAIKFVLHQALDGGAAYSLRSDNLGKSLAAGLLRMRLQLPPDWPPVPALEA